MRHRITAISAGLLWGISGAAAAQSTEIDTCFDNGDIACLEAAFADIVTNNTPEKSRAIHLLGVLDEQAGDFAAAKDRYMMSIGFGGGDDPNAALAALYENQPHVFDEPVDCFQIESEQCFEQIIANGSDEDQINSKFLLGGLLITDEAERERGLSILEEAAAGGHNTAPCLLQDSFETTDYNKFVAYGRQCGLDAPLSQISEDHFSKYENDAKNKAYAVDARGVAHYTSGVANPEVAARLALEYCNTSPHRRADTPDCVVVNINDVWVKDVDIQEIPVVVTDIDGLLTLDAQASFRDKYAQADGLKVFVQSRSGSWQWQSAGNSDRTIEVITEQALSKCNSGWRSRLDYPCEVVNINGEWVN